MATDLNKTLEMIKELDKDHRASNVTGQLIKNTQRTDEDTLSGTNPDKTVANIIRNKEK